MIQIDKTLLSEEIIENEFVCNLNACKGACCVEGSAGAPLEEGEKQQLEAVFEEVKPLLRPEGLQAIKSQGLYIKGKDGDWETPLVDDEECAYVVFENNVAKCALEEAYSQGKTGWKKPISCHLYPVRIKEYSQFTAINYHKWEICDDACTLGKSLEMPIYKFVKEALVRKFGEEWYAELEMVASEYKKREE